MQVIRCPYDLTALFDQNSTNYKMCIETVCRGLENLTQKITEFMVNFVWLILAKFMSFFCKPKEGILGTNKKSALLSIITEGNKFPDTYFWDTEKVIECY